jgi:F-type H+-transporting ATPase subunit a
MAEPLPNLKWRALRGAAWMAVIPAAVMWASAAAAAGGGHGDSAHGEKHDVAGYILHHLADSHEWEFEVPLNEHDPNPTLPLLTWHLPLKAGACPETHGEAPSLAKGCLDLSITKHMVMMWIAAILLLLLFLRGSHRDRKQLVPKGSTANLLELLVVFVRDEMAIKNIGKEHGPRYTPFLLSIFFFILAMNLLGLVPWMAAATGNLAVTAGLALCTFFITQLAAIRAAGFGTYLKHLTGGVHWALWPIMIPVEILGLFTKPFALTVRLFANMLAGHIVIFFLLGLIFVLQNAAVAFVSVPFAMAIYFLEIFVAFVQAYIFTMLSSLFIGMGVAMAHHSEHDAHHEDGHHVEGSHSHDHGRAQMVG